MAQPVSYSPVSIFSRGSMQEASTRSLSPGARSGASSGKLMFFDEFTVTLTQGRVLDSRYTLILTYTRALSCVIGPQSQAFPSKSAYFLFSWSIWLLTYHPKAELFDSEKLK